MRASSSLLGSITINVVMSKACKMPGLLHMVVTPCYGICVINCVAIVKTIPFKPGEVDYPPFEQPMHNVLISRVVPLAPTYN